MASGALQYVTLVVQGGTPIRIADQMGAPYPTTGRGALVFAESPTLNNPTFTGKVIAGQGDTIGVGVGTVGGPSLFFGNTLNQDGFFSKNLHHVNVTVGGVEVADFGPGLLTVYDDINYNGALTGGTASFDSVTLDNVIITGPITGEGGKFTGPVTGTGTPVGFIVDGPASTARYMGAATATKLRWTWGANLTPEGGANAGSNFSLVAYNDAGATLSTPFSINRATAAASFSAGFSVIGAVTFLTTLAVSGALTGSSTATFTGNVNPTVTNVPSLGTSALRWNTVNATSGNYSGTSTSRSATVIPAGGMAGGAYLFSSTVNFGLTFGSGAPTVTMARGSIYLRSDGTPYVNRDGATNWSGMAMITAGTTPPTAPNDNELWYNTDGSLGGGQLYIYYNDGNTKQWVPV